jgi:hypothetical protein
MVTEEWQYSGLKCENLYNIGSGWTELCRLFTDVVVDCSMQTLYRRLVVVVEYAECLQTSGSGSGGGLEYADC